MKIAMLRSNDCEIDIRVQKEAISLVKAGHDVVLVGCDRKASYSYKDMCINIQGVDIKRVLLGVKFQSGQGFRKNAKAMIKYQIVLKQWLKNNIEDFDCIHACDFDTGIASVGIVKKHNKKLVYDIFDYYADAHKLPFLLSGIVKSRENNIVNAADMVIICTEQRKKQIAGTTPKKLVVIHNTPDRLFMNNSEKYDEVERDKRIKIVFIGALLSKRFIIPMIDIIAASPKYSLYIGGSGEEGLVEYAKKNSDKYENIHYLGVLPYCDTLIVEKMCDVLVCIYDPKIENHRFAAPNKFYEALLLGKPVIMAKGTGLSDIIESYGWGITIDYNERAFISALQEIDINLFKYKDKSKQMQAMYYKQYSWKIMEERLLQAYRFLGNEDIIYE